MYFEFDSLNQAFIRLCRELKGHGIEQMRRGHRCYEFPEPVMIAITNPCERYVTVPERKWNRTLGWVESLWLALGSNSMTMPAAYVTNLNNFSDDGKYMRAGYGPRIRAYDSFKRVMQYKDSDVMTGNQYMEDWQSPLLAKGRVDQLRFILEKFKEDITTREACITIHNPISDDFLFRLKPVDTILQVLPTKDTPCTRSIHFMIVGGKLNCYVDIRSNDLIWGFSAVNVFNFTLMQEYVANILGVPVGVYYHKADNLHVYEDFVPLVEEVANKYYGEEFPVHSFYYPKAFSSLLDFDDAMVRIATEERLFREGVACMKDYTLEKVKSALERDWIRVFARKWEKVHHFGCSVAQERFENPILNEVFGL